MPPASLGGAPSVVARNTTLQHNAATQRERPLTHRARMEAEDGVSPIPLRPPPTRDTQRKLPGALRKQPDLTRSLADAPPRLPLVQPGSPDLPPPRPLPVRRLSAGPQQRNGGAWRSAATQRSLPDMLRKPRATLPCLPRRCPETRQRCRRLPWRTRRARQRCRKLRERCRKPPQRSRRARERRRRLRGCGPLLRQRCRKPPEPLRQLKLAEQRTRP